MVSVWKISSPHSNLYSVRVIFYSDLKTVNDFVPQTDWLVLKKARGQVLGEDGVRVHSMVLPGLASSTSVVLSGPGEVLNL